MRSIASIIVLAAPLFVAAAPWKRDAATDLAVLGTFSLSLSFFLFLFRVFDRNDIRPALTPIASTAFADVLEQLESTFYSQALAKFNAGDFTAAGFPNAQLAIEQFVSIQSDEATHSLGLQVRI